MSRLRALYEKYREIISYLFWGVMTTLVSWLTYALFDLVFRGVGAQLHVFWLSISVTVLMDSILSWICAVLFAYVTNKLWVFESKSWDRQVVWPEIAKFFSARAATGVLEIVAVPLLTAIGLDQTIFGVEGMLAKVIVTVVVVILNYILSKLLVFRTKTD